MGVAPLFLADKSALARLDHRSVDDRLGHLLVEGLVATCPIIDLEVLYSARSLVDYEAILAERRALPSYPITTAVTDRAIDVQHRLARRGHHRISLPDLLIAAVAELNDLAVMHYDADYDRIAEITNQPVEWVVPRGSV
ncbi:MAG: type II toxin-antitoxin system toxin ribonuclease C21 [Acidimicrobiia bacterium]|nr:MAG: type II toxin-antitoxin system toxin ribonuclease C21 [Acidimicrobiia bacterium]